MEFKNALRTMLNSKKVFVRDYAQAVDYDPSYISKWLSGPLLPVRKHADKVLNNSADFFTELLWDTPELDQLHEKFEGTDVDAPESYHSKEELRHFLLRLFKASYYRSIQPETKVTLGEVPLMPFLNSYITNELDEAMKLLHIHCKHMTVDKRLLRIFATVPIKLMEYVISTHERSYCMLFRANTIEVNYILDRSDHVASDLIQLTSFGSRLRKLNAKSYLSIYYKRDMRDAKFIYTEGCYYLFTMQMEKHNIYNVIDNTDLIKELETCAVDVRDSAEKVAHLGLGSDPTSAPQDPLYRGGPHRIVLRDIKSFFNALSYWNITPLFCLDIFLPKTRTMQSLNNETFFQEAHRVMESMLEMRGVRFIFFEESTLQVGIDVVLIVSEKHVQSVVFDGVSPQYDDSLLVTNSDLVDEVNSELDDLANRDKTKVMTTAEALNWIEERKK